MKESPLMIKYPDGIPMEIFREEFDQTKPYKNDNGIMFEEKTTE